MENQNVDKPVCCECGDKIKGRSDKKFCNDACRSAHHNKKNKVVCSPQKKINSVLSKNRRILKDCFEQSEDKRVPKLKLENQGFMAKAPENVVTEIRERLTKCDSDIERIEAQLKTL